MGLRFIGKDSDAGKDRRQKKSVAKNEFSVRTVHNHTFTIAETRS